ncbi:ABC transporter permease [Xylophilus sp.]|uniref:ABC transporter permease n=1 Tax=Xylophilus sp. TaxID=2653893 RepID=UPI0013BC0897|nr:ABC transporter permease [Xylophilus sp.]KAF1042503.1 MAG: Macrolide export ATP-binding/permease protein MacB [Xylophilus sp.]
MKRGQDQIALFGTHRMYVRPGTDSARGLRGVLTEADAQLVATVPNVQVAMPFLGGKAMLRAGGRDFSTSVWSVTADAPAVLQWNLARGVFFDREDERRLATVAVLGKTARERLYGSDVNTVGSHLLINSVPFLVIGELQEKGAVSGDASDDDVVLIPFSTGSRRVLGSTQLSFVSVLVDSLERIDQTVRDITAVLRHAHGVEDFRISNSAAQVQAQQEAARQQDLLLALIAGISLVVGGIGIMNIMLMAVKERTREIGIRVATGARQRDIQRQFLTEAVMVSLVGGAAGVVTGLAIGVALIAWHVPVIFSVRSMLMAFGSAVATGLVFGFIPARQAARLDPVVALAGE